MGTLIDLTGKKIGYLTVIKKLEPQPNLNPTGCKKKGKSALWLCKCDCGNFCTKRSNFLRKNPRISCGCKYSQHLSESGRIDLTGQRFGKLVVLQYSHSHNNRAMWKCQCDCGNICVITGKYLLNGETKSCGCYVSEIISQLKKKPIISGTKIGKLTVLYELKERRNKYIYYHCRCDCGNELDVKSGHLKRGDTKSCGCVASFSEVRIADFFRNNNIKFERQYKFNDCVSRKNRKLPFDFAVFDENNNLKYVLQFQGQQHFKNVFGSKQMEYAEYIQHDIDKSNYCKEHNIKLIIIDFKENLEQRLELLKNL